MLADEQRGWAWMRAIALARVPKLEIIASPDAEKLISTLSSKIGYSVQVTRHQRLQPLSVASRPWRVEQPEPGTIFVVFSRAGVLSLKTFLERRGYSVAAIYGNLPPEVKRRQAERFLSGDAQLCVATDAIGMGMNLPAARVCFTTLSKYDGKEQRVLLPSEARQIAGRAGRYGLKQSGEAGALTYDDVRTLQRLLKIEPPDLEFARITPELADLEQMRGPLAKRLEEWEKRLTIPEELKELLLPANLEQQKMLAGFVRPEEVERLGLEFVFTLIKAPASRDSISYWYACVRAIAENQPIPVPHSLQQMERGNKDALLGAEQAVEQCDVYLWIANREGLKEYAPEKEKVQEYKWSLVERIDQVLALRQDMRQKCKKCGKILPLLHAFSVCESCFKGGRRHHRPGPRRAPFRFRR
jgi:ATP-dependent RNA helicase SUPV3L1/SUV3